MLKSFYISVKYLKIVVYIFLSSVYQSNRQKSRSFTLVLQLSHLDTSLPLFSYLPPSLYLSLVSFFLLSLNREAFTQIKNLAASAACLCHNNEKRSQNAPEGS